MKILLGGIPLGCDNIGDEAIIACVVGMLKGSVPRVELTVATADPETAKLLGVNVVPPFGFAGRSLEGFADAVRAHDAYIWCGATGLSDYPHVALDLLETAQDAGVPTYIWGVGMDDELNPVFFKAHGKRRLALKCLGLVGWYERRLRDKLKARIAAILPRCRGVWLRDPQSAAMLASLGFADAGIAADTAILLDRVGIGSDRVGIGSDRVKIGSDRVKIGSDRVKIGSDRVGETLIDPNPTLNDPNSTLKDSNLTLKDSNLTLKDSNPTLKDPNLPCPTLGLCISTQRQVADLGGLKRMIAAVRDSGARVLGIPMNPKTDRALLEKLGVECIPGTTPEAVVEAAAGCDVVLSSRLHLLILAANAGTPVLGIARGSKLANWLSNFARTVEGSVYDCDWEKVTEHVLSALRERGEWDAVRDRAYAGLMSRFEKARGELVARLTGVPPADWPRVSVLVRAYNDEALVGRTLSGIFSQWPPPFEVIVCDDNSKDRTREVAAKFPVRFVDRPSGPYKPGRTLNALVREAKGDIVVFNNSDSVPLDSHWLAELVKPLTGGSSRVFAFANQLPRADAQALVCKDNERAFGDGKVQATWRFFFSLASSATWRQNLLDVPFDEQVQYSEDVEWTWSNSRLADDPVKVVYCPDSHVEHSHNYTLRELWKRFKGEGVADRVIYGDRPSLIREIIGSARETLRDWAYLLVRPRGWAEAPSAPIRRLVQRVAHWKGIRQAFDAETQNRGETCAKS